jgi:hypothetical protein
MTDTDRRGFLRGGLKAALVGTGGLPLPWQGGGALALPDLGIAAMVPVKSVPLPVSAECLALREIIERQREHYRRKHQSRSCEVTSAEWRAMAEQYSALADVVLARPVTTWGQASEVAEIAWRYHDKAWGPAPNYFSRYYSPPVLEGTLEALTIASGRDRMGQRTRSPNAVLIDAVLSLGGGERNDPDDWSANLYRERESA